MTPSTIVRRPRGPFTFTGFVGLILERETGTSPKARSRLHTCCRLQDDGSPCGLPAPYVSFADGGRVCFEHRPPVRKAVMA